MKSLLLFALVFLIVFPLWAKQCNQTEYGVENLAALKEARAKKTKGLAKYLTEYEFEVKIMHSASLNKYVTFFGEFHIKRRKSFRLGEKAIKPFDYRFYEAVPEAEYKPVGKKIHTAMWLSKLLLWRFRGSNIHSSEKQSPLIGQGNPGLLILDYKHKKKEEYTKAINQPEDVVEALAYLNSKHNDLKCVNLPIEVGDYIKPSTEDSYVLDARNVRMSKSILHYMNNIEQVRSPLVMVGMAHIPGLVDLLKKESDFQVCDNF